MKPHSGGPLQAAPCRESDRRSRAASMAQAALVCLGLSVGCVSLISLGRSQADQPPQRCGQEARGEHAAGAVAAAGAATAAGPLPEAAVCQAYHGRAVPLRGLAQDGPQGGGSPSVVAGAPARPAADAQAGTAATPPGAECREQHECAGTPRERDAGGGHPRITGGAAPSAGARAGHWPARWGRAGRWVPQPARAAAAPQPAARAGSAALRPGR